MNKFKLAYVFLLTSVITLFSMCNSNKSALESKIVFAKNPVVAHRGAWKKNNFPENSIASLKQAIKLKCTGSEFDVRMTSDDILIINHDPHYHNLPIEKTTYANLLAFKLSNGEKLPTLKEYILAGIENNSSTMLVCEIKPSEINKERGILIATKVVELIKELKASHMVAFISFDYDILKKIRALNPTVSTQYLEGNKSPEQLKAAGISGADYHYSVFKTHPEWIESAKENNITLNAWTVNEAADMDWLLANDFDFITTNEPELLLERIAQFKATYKDYKLVWSDEFNINGAPNSNKWGYDLGTGNGGWGNNESQFYTNRADNVIVEGGLLKIIAKKENYQGALYTSTRMLTAGKFDFKYGKVEVRAKLPQGKGTWPAIWMLGSNITTVGWPDCGEVDIMEHAGNRQGIVQSAMHTPSSYGNTSNLGSQTLADVSTAFHVYAVEWTSEKMIFSVDGVVHYTYNPAIKNSSTWPFNANQFIILNVAMGGTFGGTIEPNFTQSTMEIDYVRVYQ